MKWKKSSWHWQIYSSFYNTNPSRIGICKYFWRCVIAAVGFSILMLLFGLVALVGVSADESETKKRKAAIGGASIAAGLGLLFAGVTVSTLSTSIVIVAISMILGINGAFLIIVGVIVELVCGVEILLDWLTIRKQHKHVATDRTKAPPGLVISMYRAAKKRMCPIIEFED